MREPITPAASARFVQAISELAGLATTSPRPRSLPAGVW